MKAEWIHRIRLKYNQLFENLKGDIQKEGMYFIPKKYQDSRNLYSKQAQKKDIIQSQIEFNDTIYREMQNQIPEQTGKTLEALFEHPTDDLLIHRTDYSLEQVQQILFQMGLPVRDTDYTAHLSKYKHFPTILQQISTCGEYKNAQGCLLVRIPKKNTLPLYYENNAFIMNTTQLFLLPEYIYGYVPVIDGQVKDIIKNPNYIENHNYASEGLYYDEILNPVAYQNQVEENRKKGK